MNVIRRTLNQNNDEFDRKFDPLCFISTGYLSISYSMINCAILVCLFINFIYLNHLLIVYLVLRFRSSLKFCVLQLNPKIRLIRQIGQIYLFFFAIEI